MSITEDYLKVFEDGPGLIDDVVLELKTDPRRTSAMLNHLVRTRRLVRQPFWLCPELKKDGRETVWLYSLPDYRMAA